MAWGRFVRRRKALQADGQRLVTLVFRERGCTKVTIAYCKKRLPFLRAIHDGTVAAALHFAVVKWLTRRLKRWIPNNSKETRVSYCQSLLRRHRSSLNRFAYTDGTTFYLVRGPTEHDEKKRQALGRSVWRMANGSDALFNDNIIPSLYAKAQGLPVKTWASSQMAGWNTTCCQKMNREKRPNSRSGGGIVSQMASQSIWFRTTRGACGNRAIWRPYGRPIAP